MEDKTHLSSNMELHVTLEALIREKSMLYMAGVGEERGNLVFREEKTENVDDKGEYGV